MAARRCLRPCPGCPQRVPGVVDTCVGYAQGQVESPTYEQVRRAQVGAGWRQPDSWHVPPPESGVRSLLPPLQPCSPAHLACRVPRSSAPQVCSGSTGHTEAVQLTYRPAEVSFDQLCSAFLNKIDPKQARACLVSRG